MTDLSAYRDFIASKGRLSDTTGMTPRDMLPALKHHQAVSVDYAAQAAKFLAEAEREASDMFAAE